MILLNGLRLFVLRRHLRLAERAMDQPWTRRASARLDRAMLALENLEG